MTLTLHLGTSKLAGSFVELLDAAVGHFEWLDTAPYYCDGRLPDLLGEAQQRVQFFEVTTRVPCAGSPGQPSADTSYPLGWIGSSIRKQLKQARLDHFSLVLLERWDCSWDPSRVRGELRNLQREGLAKQIGISVPDSAPGAAEAFSDSFEMVIQGDGSLARRNFLKPWQDTYRSQGHALQARAPFFHGLFAKSFSYEAVIGEGSARSSLFKTLGKGLESIRSAYTRAAAELGTTVDVLALAYVRELLGNGGVILGCSSAPQLAWNIRAWYQSSDLLVKSPISTAIPNLRIGE
ncbi:aldo/keto reductase [Streptomyces sp. NPDC002952]|uniref:aldo/keto reductase n=1 Tax=Streptomyces sp. NPDC002952 TaxID=3364673 RepID=UPI0036CE9D81